MNFEVFAQEHFLPAALYLFLFLILFFIARLVKDVLTPYKISVELTKKDNLSIALTMSGYYLGVAAIFISASMGPETNHQSDLIDVALYSLLGVVFLNLSRFINDRIILKDFSHVKDLSEGGNTAVAVVHFSTYLATALIAAAAIHGEGGGLLTSVVFFLLGQVVLLIFAKFYEMLTKYSLMDELKSNNSAAGIAFGGTLIALSIILFNAISGSFEKWDESLIHFAVVTVLAFIFLPAVRFLMNQFVIPMDDLNKEIAEDKNTGVGFLEAAVAISFALVFAFTV